MKIYRPSDTCFDEMKRRMNRRALRKGYRERYYPGCFRARG